MCGEARINKARRMFHVNCLNEMTMKKSIFDIQLMKLPTMKNSKRQDKTNSSCFDNRTESEGIIKSWNLRETLSHQRRLYALNCAITFELGTKDPLATNDIGSRRARNQSPSDILM